MTDTFTPARFPITNGTSLSLSPRLLQNKMGDGYTVTTPDGLNPNIGQLMLVFNLLKNEANDVEDFLRAHTGVPFYYTLPGRTDNPLWIWKSFQRSPTNGLAYEQVTINLEEQFYIAPS